VLGVEQWAELRRRHFVQGISIRQLQRDRDQDDVRRPCRKITELLQGEDGIEDGPHHADDVRCGHGQGTRARNQPQTQDGDHHPDRHGDDPLDRVRSEAERYRNRERGRDEPQDPGGLSRFILTVIPARTLWSRRAGGRMR